MISHTREALWMVPSKDFLERHRKLRSQLPVRGPGLVSSVHGVVDERLLIALRPDPELAHRVKETFFGPGFLHHVAGAAVAEFNASWMKVDGSL